MSISFDQIPGNLRTPGYFIEFDSSLAGALSTEFTVLITGQMLPTGTATPDELVLVSDGDEGANLFGVGSHLSEMVYAFKAVPSAKFLTMYVIPQIDLLAGVPSVGSLVITDPATGDGILTIYFGGRKIQAAVASGDTPTIIGDSLVAAITADARMMVTAVNALGTVTITAKNDGENGNQIDISANLFDEVLPDGVGLTINAMGTGTAGAGNPDITEVIATMADDKYNWIAMPYTDSGNIDLLEAELLRRFGPMVSIGGRAFNAFRGNLAATAGFGALNNSPHITTMGSNISPTPPFILAAINTAVAGASLLNDPARPLQSLQLNGFIPAKADVQWDQAERNTLLFDGIATQKSSRDGRSFIERQITNFQINDQGFPDAAYLDIQTAETLDRIRDIQRATIATKFGRHKLADDGTNFAAGQPVVTPQIIKTELLAMYTNFIEDLAWAEDYDGYLETLIVERDGTDKNRINVQDSPNLINQFRVGAQKTQFRV